VQDGAGRGGGVERRRVWGAAVTRERPSCRTPVATRWTFVWSIRGSGCAPRRGGHRGAGLCCGVRASGRRSPLRLLVAFGNEGGRPGGLRGPCARGWSQAACVLQHVGAQEANHLGFLPETGRNSRGLANCPGLASENGANPGQFGRSPASCCERRALCGKSQAREHTKPLDPLPHCPFATSDTARRAAPAGADPERPRWRGPRSGAPAARTPSAPAGADPEVAPVGPDPERPRQRPRQPRRLTPTRSHRTPPGPAAAASRPQPARRGVDTDPRSTIGARRRRSLPCRRSALPRGGRRR